MTILQALILGVIQGLTEFLPISSSGHLVLAPYYFGWTIPDEQVFVFDVLVQIGTLLAVVIYFWKDLWGIVRVTLSSIGKPDPWGKEEIRLGVYIIIATIPAVVIGFLFKDAVEAAFTDFQATAYFLLLTAVLLVVAELVGKRSKGLQEIQWYDALWIGFFQAMALFPGVSRSGATITGGMTRNLDRPTAARFSFLIAVPVMIGAGALTVFDLFAVPDLGAFILPMLAGFVSAAVVGYIAIHWLLKFLARSPMYVFSAYLVILSVFTLLRG
jgi:undecaprenyl-diphosphatase